MLRRAAATFPNAAAPATCKCCQAEHVPVLNASFAGEGAASKDAGRQLAQSIGVSYELGKRKLDLESAVALGVAKKPAAEPAPADV
jgi:hypothetical protein